MDREGRKSPFGSFLLGGLVGSLAGLAAAGQMKMKPRTDPRRRESPEGLAAFEGAPCYRELLERERRERAS